MGTHNDNTQTNTGTGDKVRTVSRTADDGTQVKAQAVALDVGGAGDEHLVSEVAPVPTFDAQCYAKLCEAVDILTLIYERIK